MSVTFLDQSISFEAFLALTALFLDVGVVGYTFKQVKHDELIRTYSNFNELIRTIRTLDEL